MTDRESLTMERRFKSWTARLFPFVAFVGLASGCAAQKSGGKPYYHEDLYSLRPKYQDTVVATLPETRKKGDVIPTANVNQKVDAVLDSINRFNVTRKFIDGFTLKIYSGLKREEAMNANMKVI